MSTITRYFDSVCFLIFSYCFLIILGKYMLGLATSFILEIVKLTIGSFQEISNLEKKYFKKTFRWTLRLHVNNIHVKAVLDNAITTLTDRAEQGVRPNPDCSQVNQKEALSARPARLATTNVTDWKLEQQEDPVLYQVLKHRKASCEIFKEALKVLSGS